jgi:hypothetical protein
MKVFIAQQMGFLDMANYDDRKQRIMEHLSRSSGDFIKRSTLASNRDRKQQIMNHIRKTSG